MSTTYDAALPAPPGPTALDALSLLTAVADELVLGTARDTHRAFADRVHGVVRRGTGPTGLPGELLHRGIAAGVYGAIGLTLAGTSRGLDLLSVTAPSPRLDDSARGRFLTAAVNGLIGDELLRERPQLAIAMSVRSQDHDVPTDRDALAEAFPEATGRLVVFLHGLCENESAWDVHRARTGTTYGDTLATAGWSPVRLRYNSGLAVRENGAALASLLERLTAAWPVPVERIALVGHSMGALVCRAATAVVADSGRAPSWSDRVSDVVSLGAPHLGSRVAKGAAGGSRLLQLLPESSAFSARILERRSAGIRDLTEGLTDDVPPLPRARYRLVAATLTESARHPLAALVGDLLVHPTSAVGRDPQGRELFPDAEQLHVGRTDHFGLLNHPAVLAALERWLA